MRRVASGAVPVDRAAQRVRRVVVVAASARLLAEAAVADGWQVASCDAYGDADTRAASDAWWPLGPADGASTAALDGQRLLAALTEEARRGAVGWVAGSGFDGRPDLLEEGGRVLPLIGADPDAVRRLRDPRWFFARLQAHGIAHPEVRFDMPESVDGWLRKDASSTGGWGVVGAGDAVGAPGTSSTRYWQRAMAGVPMSATFLAGAADVRVLSHNGQWTCRIGARRHIHAGLVGPVAVTPTTSRQVLHACRMLAQDAGLRGLASLDFLLAADGAVWVLEVNPRPSASIAVCAGGAFHDSCEASATPTETAPIGGRTGLFDAHLDAARHGALPDGAWASPAAVTGTRTVYADRTIALAPRHLDLLAGWPGCHDRPAEPQRVRRGDPLCSLMAALPGPDAPALLATRLDADRQRVLAALDFPEDSRP